MDRYGLAREFELQKFEMQIMKCEDLYATAEIAMKLFSQTLAQQSVYESMLLIWGSCRRSPEPAYLLCTQVLNAATVLTIWTRQWLAAPRGTCLNHALLPLRR